MNKPFVFVGSGLGYLWLLIWTTVVSIVTLGLFFPWAYSAQQRWICANTYVEGRRLRFDGTGLGFFFQWLVINRGYLNIYLSVNLCIVSATSSPIIGLF